MKFEEYIQNPFFTDSELESIMQWKYIKIFFLTIACFSSFRVTINIDLNLLHSIFAMAGLVFTFSYGLFVLFRHIHLINKRGNQLYPS